MKQALGWWWPDHEQHLIKWMQGESPPVINGRLAYQGRKQIAATKACRSFHTAIDVGAHVGLWSYNLSRQFSRVVAFEPVAAHRECFEKNVASRGNVDLHPCALGAEQGAVNISVTEGSSGDSKIDGSGGVPLHTLDSFKIPHVDFIKIDCEGYEENVLVGAESTITHWKPVVIVEQKRDMAARFGLKPQGAVEWLRERGYEVLQDIGGDFLMVPA